MSVFRIERRLDSWPLNSPTFRTRRVEVPSGRLDSCCFGPHLGSSNWVLSGKPTNQQYELVPRKPQPHKYVYCCYWIQCIYCCNSYRYYRKIYNYFTECMPKIAFFIVTVTPISVSDSSDTPQLFVSLHPWLMVVGARPLVLVILN